MMTEQHDAEPRVWLDPDDARSAEAAGATFARVMAGAPPEWFALALEQQRAIVSAGIRMAAFPDRQAQLAADAFVDGARGEWQRLGNVSCVGNA